MFKKQPDKSTSGPAGNTACRVLAIQKKTYSTPRENMKAAEAVLTKYRDARPDFIMLPEIFTCPYDNSCFPAWAQEEGGEVCSWLSEMAGKHHAWLIGGSVPELGPDGKIYNTSYIYDRTGRLAGKHRKVHLFDIDVEGGQSFRESDVLSPGESATVIETEFGKIGVCICFDIRFPQLFLDMRSAGVRMVFVPAAFNMTTGPLHWELLFRARAVDHQIYLLGCSPARDETASYIAYGHSILTDPWGKIRRELDAGEDVLLEDLDLSVVEQVRRQIPL